MFLVRLGETVELRHVLVGLGKAPLFAVVIALVGCLEGFQVKGTGRIGGRAHDLERGAVDLAGDRARCAGGAVLHGDGVVSAPVPEDDPRPRDGRRRAPTRNSPSRCAGSPISFGEQVVHENLDLDVRRGEIIGVVGGSGTGKSVLMRAILGLRTPQAGSIEVMGVDALDEKGRASRDRAQQRRAVPDGALFSSLTVARTSRCRSRSTTRSCRSTSCTSWRCSRSACPA
jgi:ABC-type multidrug transport system fused ATPase/permease subunit